MTNVLRRRGNTVSLLVGLALLATMMMAFAEEARIIQLKHRTAAEIIPLIQPMLGPHDALMGTDYRLIVRTSDATLRDIERILAQLDVSRRQLTITVEQFSTDNRTQNTQSVSGRTGIGDNTRIALPDPFPSKSGIVIEKDNLRYSATSSLHSSSNKNTQTLTTLDGQPAFIRIGQSVPQVKRILGISRKDVTVLQEVGYQDVISGFGLLPRVRGEHVRIEITPQLSTLENPETGLVNFQELATTVEVKLGEWIDLSTILGNRSEIHQAILESGVTKSNEHRIVRLRVD